MLKKLTVEDFTVFSSADIKFASNLNVVVGENGLGKTHLLKILYSVLSVSHDLGKRHAGPPTKTALQGALAEKLVNVFRPESLGRLVRRRQGRGRSEVSVRFDSRALALDFNFSSLSKSEVTIERLPSEWSNVQPAYLPTRELMSLYPGFVSLYEGRYLEFEETWRDTCLLLGQPLFRGPRAAEAASLLVPIEDAMGGKVVLDKNGRFYLRLPGSGNMEMHLVAEGWRKLCMLAQLIANGSLLDKGSLFWDEPEANLNPMMVKLVARTIFELAKSGIQVFIGTHSLFLLRELEILIATSSERLDATFFGLHGSETGTEVVQGTDTSEIGDIAALDASLEQSDRYLEV